MEPVEAFQAFRRVLCICPCCGQLRRLSDLQISYAGKTQPTWLDAFETKVGSLQKREEKFEQKEEELREKARERGRKKVPLFVNKMMTPDIAKLGLDPYDIKAVFHPVDFTVFKGLNAGETVDEILFLARRSAGMRQHHEAVKRCVESKAYEWAVA